MLSALTINYLTPVMAEGTDDELDQTQYEYRIHIMVIQLI